MIESVGFQDVQVYQDHDLAEDDYDDDDASGKDTVLLAILPLTTTSIVCLKGSGHYW